MVGVPGRSKGCATCRKRKKKCDLAKPGCVRCQVSGLACEGYDRFPIFINRTAEGIQKRRPFEEVKVSPPPESGTSSPSPDPSPVVFVHQQVVVRKRTPSLTPPLNPERFLLEKERRSLDFFRQHSSSRLSGYNVHNFWSDFVLQLSGSDHGIRHLIVAIGAIHEQWETQPEFLSLPKQERFSTFVLSECNKAITYITKNAATNEMQLINLTSSLLFTIIELMLNRYEIASRFMRNGLSLLNGWRREIAGRTSRNDQDDIIEHLVEPMFAGYTRQLPSQFTYSALPLLSTPSIQHDLASSIALPFTNLDQAKEEMDTFIHRLGSMLLRAEREAKLNNDYNDDSISDAVRSELSNSLLSWRRRLAHLLIESGPTARQHGQFRYRRDRALLQVRYHMAKITLATSRLAFVRPFMRSVFEGQFDDYYDDFYQLIEHTESFLQIEKEHSLHPAANTGQFSFDNCVLFPLYFTASSCRHAELRRAAVRLLHTYTRQERFFTTTFAAFILEELIQMEEDGYQDVGYVPPEARARLDCLVYVAGTGTTLPTLTITWSRACVTTDPTAGGFTEMEARKTIHLPQDLSISKTGWTVSMGSQPFIEPEQVYNTVSGVDEPITPVDPPSSTATHWDSQNPKQYNFNASHEVMQPASQKTTDVELQGLGIDASRGTNVVYPHYNNTSLHL